MNIFRKDKGIAIARAMIEMFVRVVYFRKALIEIARARVMTKKNQRRMIVFHLYFIRMNIVAKAKAKENMIVRRPGAGSSFGVSSPNGRLSWDRIISPVVSFMVDVGAYVLTTKSPIACVTRNIVRRIIVIESLCFIDFFL